MLLGYSDWRPPKPQADSQWSPFTPPDLYRAVTSGSQDRHPTYDPVADLWYIAFDSGDVTWSKSRIALQSTTWRVRQLVRFVDHSGSAARARWHFGRTTNEDECMRVEVGTSRTNDTTILNGQNTVLEAADLGLQDDVWYVLDIRYDPERARVRIYERGEDEPDWQMDVATPDYDPFEMMRLDGPLSGVSLHAGPISITDGDAGPLDNPYPLGPSSTRTQVYVPVESTPGNGVFRHFGVLGKTQASATMVVGVDRDGDLVRVDTTSNGGEGLLVEDQVDRTPTNRIHLWGRMKVPAAPASDFLTAGLCVGFNNRAGTATSLSQQSVIMGVRVDSGGDVFAVVAKHDGAGTTNTTSSTALVGISPDDMVEVLCEYDADGSSRVKVWPAGDAEPGSWTHTDPGTTPINLPDLTPNVGWAVYDAGQGAVSFGDIGVGLDDSPAPRGPIDSIVRISVPTSDLPDSGSGPEAVTGLRYGLWDQPTPDVVDRAPVRSGTTQIGADGALAINTLGRLGVGQWGWLTVTDSDGDGEDCNVVTGPVEARDPADVGALFSGGEIAIIDGYVYHSFRAPGSHTLTPLDGPVSGVDRLVIGGGGGGGSRQGGGGGAGEPVLDTDLTISAPESITVGEGGPGGAPGDGEPGANSTAGAATALGGGYGGGRNGTDDGGDGASGGGSTQSGDAGAATATGGNAGGEGASNGGGGGGGFGAEGGDAPGTNSIGGSFSDGGDGGDGVEVPEFAAVLQATSGWVSAGAGGGSFDGATGEGGQGGGGDGGHAEGAGPPTQGVDGTGSGGGGNGGGSANPGVGARGGHGSVHYRYPLPES